MKKTTQALHAHLAELNNPHSITPQKLNSFIKRLSIVGNIGINANSIFYVLNLNSMKYEYINDACKTFTGFESTQFMNRGMNILPDIIDKKDFINLSTVLFPEMNNVVKTLSTTEKKNIVFEFFYHFENIETGKKIAIREYSSYTEFDKDGNPILSTGLCYETSEEFSGIKGFVRLNEGRQQQTLYSLKINYALESLTKRELKIANLIAAGFSRKEIAEQLLVSTETIKTHTKNIFKKVGVKKSTDLVKVIGF